MYLFITIESFITNQKSLTVISFQDILKFLLIIIGPYTILFFFKANKDDFLTIKNKRNLERFIRKYKLKMQIIHSRILNLRQKGRLLLSK